ncbi:MAG TPA: SpoIIE family protein phosphatase [Dongiaceae bacterium]|jgi:anti-sigma regulatory factor (Ser/Thr protein kinase)
MRLFTINEASRVAEVRREAGAMGKSHGLSETDLGRLAIVVTELATNQLKHAHGGEILIDAYEDGTGEGIEIIGIDRGPGIRNLGESMRDGHSTAGSAGQGLGALKRQSDLFEIASWQDRGVVVVCRIATKKLAKGTVTPKFVWGGVSIPLAGQEVCGDAFSVRPHGDGLSVLVADGLGHGPVAAMASAAAVRSFSQGNGAMPTEILRTMHEALRPTRGAAVAVLRLEQNGAHYAGIGNIAGAVLRSDGISRMVSMTGTAGFTQTKIRAFEYPAGPGSLVIMASDGIVTGWTLDPYPGLSRAHPSLIAAVLFRDFSRGRDDATVVAIRMEAA